MPAIITHHVFGEEAAGALPQGILEGQEELLAFLLGNQGPDPFFARFSTLPRRAGACHRLAHQMHSGHVVQALLAARDAAARLVDEDARVGRAFVLGLAAHYVLDSSTHGFVFAQQYALIEADPDLEGSGSEVHAVIESELDSWVSWQHRHATVDDAPPAAELARTDRIDRVAGAIMAQVALQVFGIELGPSEYAGAVRDFQAMYALIEPASSMRTRALAVCERLFRAHSRLHAQAHYARTSDDCPAANLARHAWTDPFTGRVSHESFADRFDVARGRWPGFAEALVRGDEDGLLALTEGLNYDGRPVTE